MRHTIERPRRRRSPLRAAATITILAMGAILFPAAAVHAAELDPAVPDVTIECESVTFADFDVTADRNNTGGEPGEEAESISFVVSDGAGTVLSTTTVPFPFASNPGQVVGYNPSYDTPPMYNPVSVEVVSDEGNELPEVSLLSDEETLTCDDEELPLFVAPGAPTDVVATPGSESASVAFAPGDNEGPDVISYEATCVNTDDVKSATGTGSPIAVTDLTNDVEYSCTVTATNAAGTSAASAAATVTPAQVAPSAPQNVTANPGVWSASVAFAAPANPGTDPITSYRATCTASGQTLRTNTGASSPIVVSQLTAGVQYTCMVTATSAAGPSPASAGATVTPITPSTPGAPHSVQAYAGHQNIVVVFEAPANPGTSPVLGYQAVCVPPPLVIPSAPRFATGGTQLAIRVGELRSDVTYRCSVRAFSDVGPGPFSAAATARTQAPPHKFVDVPTSAFYNAPVSWLVSIGVTTGYAGSHFYAPSLAVTRGEMATFLYRLAGSPAVSGTSGFADVPTNAFYSKAVTWARQQGITTGYAGSNFYGPSLPVSRGEMATFLHRFARTPGVSGTSGFADVPTNAFYSKAVTWLRQNGITTGYGGSNFFAPTLPVSRGEMATFLYRLGTK